MLPLHRYACINLSEMIGSRQVELGKVEGFRGSSKHTLKTSPYNFCTIFQTISKPYDNFKYKINCKYSGLERYQGEEMNNSKQKYHFKYI